VMVMSLPSIPVKPHINTVKCSISRFLFNWWGAGVSGCIKYKSSKKREQLA